MAKLILFTGGARSGKSTHAERYAKLQDRPVTYVATAEAGDQEMELRIAQHRKQRPTSWHTIEQTQQIGAALGAVAPQSVVLLDCLTLLATNILLTHTSAPEAALQHEVEELLRVARERDLTLIIVTNEVGMGIVPEYPLGRLFRDIVGRVTQRIALEADEVYLVVAGIVVELRSLEAAWSRTAAQ